MKNFGTSNEAIEARKKAGKKEFIRKQKLKQNLNKLLIKEGYEAKEKQKTKNVKVNPFEKVAKAIENVKKTNQEKRAVTYF
jgi:hypothetical protein